ncbi:uncharacterized protein EAE98_007056 [Botrytis deweyae]|uniref:Uncharacterized protein n=1 Tax=Botrytis deweyae TaxID=2478750 RepID=A0ABQ7IID1_9HELO|nr:uncharacterized protein EAE98_007056 [Botrytis deweyae]KAF7924968.1 hypothetical protein EAE98_007056 [Botrytis deweyae]
MGSDGTAQQQNSSRGRRKDDAFDQYGATSLEIQSLRAKLLTSSKNLEEAKENWEPFLLDSQNHTKEQETRIEDHKLATSNAESIEDSGNQAIELIQKVLDDREKLSKDIDEKSRKQIAAFKLLSPKLETRVEKMLADHDHFVVQMTTKNASLIQQVGELNGQVTAYTSGAHVGELKSYLEGQMKSLKEGNQADSILSANLRTEIANLQGRLNIATQKKSDAEVKERLSNQALEALRAEHATLKRQKEEAEENSQTWSENYDKIFDEKKQLSALKESNDRNLRELGDELNRVLEEHRSKVSNLESDLDREKEKSEGYSQRLRDFEAEQVRRERDEKVRRDEENSRVEQERHRMEMEMRRLEQELKSRREEEEKAREDARNAPAGDDVRDRRAKFLDELKIQTLETQIEKLKVQLETSSGVKDNLEAELSRQKQIAMTVPRLNQELQQQREIATKVPALENEVSRLKSISDRVPDLHLDIKSLREEISRLNLQGETNQTEWNGEVTKYERSLNEVQKQLRKSSNDLNEKDAKINQLELDLETSFNLREQLEQDLIQKDEIIRQKTSDNETLMLRVTHSDNVDDLKAAFEKEKAELLDLKATALRDKWEMRVVKEDENRKLRTSWHKDSARLEKLLKQALDRKESYKERDNELVHMINSQEKKVQEFTKSRQEVEENLRIDLLESGQERERLQGIIRQYEELQVENERSYADSQEQIDLLKSKESQLNDLQDSYDTQKDLLERTQNRIKDLLEGARYARLEGEIVQGKEEIKRLQRLIEMNDREVEKFKVTLTNLNAAAFKYEQEKKDDQITLTSKKEEIHKLSTELLFTRPLEDYENLEQRYHTLDQRYQDLETRNKGLEQRYSTMKSLEEYQTLEKRASAMVPIDMYTKLDERLKAILVNPESDHAVATRIGQVTKGMKTEEEFNELLEEKRNLSQQVASMYSASDYQTLVDSIKSLKTQNAELMTLNNSSSQNSPRPNLTPLPGLASFPNPYTPVQEQRNVQPWSGQSSISQGYGLTSLFGTPSPTQREQGYHLSPLQPSGHMQPLSASPPPPPPPPPHYGLGSSSSSAPTVGGSQPSSQGFGHIQPPPFSLGSPASRQPNVQNAPRQQSNQQQLQSAFTPHHASLQQVPPPQPAVSFTLPYRFLVSGRPSGGVLTVNVLPTLIPMMNAQITRWSNVSSGKGSTWAQRTSASSSRCVEVRLKKEPVRKSPPSSDFGDKFACQNCIEKKLLCVLIGDNGPVIAPLPLEDRVANSTPLLPGYYVN